MQKTMPAIVKAKAEPGLWLEQVPVPEVGSDDVLIRTKKASICGTDVHIYNWDAWAQKTIPVPMTIGHEFVGEIAATGSNVRGFAEGDLVVGEGHITCGPSPVPEHPGCRRQSSRRMGRVRCDSRDQCVAC
jgi:threonine 3-dehydrogenase